MANALRGEVDLMAGESTYRLVYDANAFVYAEEALSPLKTDDIVGRVEATASKVDMKLTRALVWAGLQRNHACTLADAGDILAEAGFGAARTAVWAGMAAAFGTAEGKEKSDPPKKARAGTG